MFGGVAWVVANGGTSGGGGYNVTVVTDIRGFGLSLGGKAPLGVRSLH